MSTDARKRYYAAHRLARSGRSGRSAELLLQIAMAQSSPFGRFSVIHLWVNGLRVKTIPPGTYDFRVREMRPYGYMKWLWDLEVIGFETQGSC